MSDETSSKTGGSAPKVATRPIEGRDNPEDRWRDHPWLARVFRLSILLIPILIAFLFALAATTAWGAYEGFWPNVGRWLTIAAASTVLLIVLQMLAKRLLPLAALFSLTLVFPDSAPSRFGLALRTGTTRQLEAKMKHIDGEGLGDTPREAAETMLELVAGLSRHDRMTRGHSERVRAYSRMIGEEMDLERDELDRLHWAGLLHDVGKHYVPAEILNKPGRLTDEEFDVIKTHPEHGQRLVAPLVDWLGPSAAAVWEHHERWEGGGYPTGVSSRETALASRIVCVADAFDVMTSARSYKKPMAASKARAELERCAGTQFDPTVVRAMMSVSLGRLWASMGPLSLIAQIRLFPRRLLQGGATVAGVTAATVGVIVTTLAGGLPSAAERPDSSVPAIVDGGGDVGEPVADLPPAPTEPVATTTTTTTTSTSTTTTTTSTTTTTTTTTLPVTTTTRSPTTTAGPTTVPSVTPTTVRPATVPTTTPPATTPPPTTTPTTTTTTTTTLPTGLLVLGSSAAGDVSSSAVLPLVARAPINGTALPNYDIDRNVDPGLTIERSVAGLTTNDPALRQIWRAPSSALSLGSPVRLQVWLAPASDPVGGFMVVRAGLYDCATSGDDCTNLADDIGVLAPSVGVFSGVSFDLTPGGGRYDVPSGRIVEVRLAVAESSATDAIVAYDTDRFPSSMTFG
jgi:HD-GYP domain-containing protein (c-di-GMP phosphodiesterase class II)